MRTRDIKFWENKIISEELSRKTKKQVASSSFPQNPTEEQNYEIAAYFVHQQDKQNRSHCKQVA
jgi:hypothetical protein